MPTRYLKETICTSDNLAQLSAEAERFWYRLIVQVDDFGRYDARPSVLRAYCFPLLIDKVSEHNIMVWLAEMRDANLLRLYTVDGKPYLELLTFCKHNHPRAQTSKYPAPPANADTCMQMPANVTESESESESESVDDAERAESLTPSPTVARASTTRTVAVKPNAKLSPAVNSVAKLTGKFPPRGIHHLIDAAMATRDDPDLLRRCYETWLSRGYRPENNAWLLEWYASGVIPPPLNGNGRVAKPAEIPAADF